MVLRVLSLWMDDVKYCILSYLVLFWCVKIDGGVLQVFY
jgi:hypothetical protein